MKKDYVGLPSPSVIAEYWKKRRPSHPSWGGIFPDNCWRCGTTFTARRTRKGESSNRNRCHIVPADLGGSNHPSNMILLCAECHRDAPDVDDPEFMWRWIEQTHSECHYASFAEAFHIYEKVFGPCPMAGEARDTLAKAGRVSLFPDAEGMDESEVEAFNRKVQPALKRALVRTISHAGRRTPASVAWAMHEAVKAAQSSD